jgi:hypothetical protein
MPLTAAQTTQFFQILGIPQDGSGDVFSSVASLFGPAYESYDLSAIVTRINTKLTALSATQLTRVTELLDRHTAITATSPLAVNESAGTRGTLSNHASERKAIRHELCNIAGIAIPAGGFAAEADRMTRGAGTIER